MVPPADEFPRELATRFFRLFKVLRSSVFQSHPSGLKPSPFLVMMHLRKWSEKGSRGLRVSDIAGRTGMTLPGTTQIINGLERQGLVRRDADPKDRRAVLIYPTDDGLRLMEPAMRNLAAKLAGLSEALGAEDSRKLLALLDEAEAYLNG